MRCLKTQDIFMHFTALILILFTLAGCARGQGISLLPYQDPDATLYDFKLCHGFGCTSRTQVKMDKKSWQKALKPLRVKSKTAEQERRNITKSIALIEREIQKNTGMNIDLGQARTFEKDQHQMDCLDETINTSRYLDFIHQEGLLHHHDVAEPIHRGYFVDGMWPHNSAAVQERMTGQIYAIDSYYSDNGGEVHVVPLDLWLAHWKPDSAFVPPKPQKKPRRRS